jgi:hypothetical protein
MPYAACLDTCAVRGLACEVTGAYVGVLQALMRTLTVPAGAAWVMRPPQMTRMTHRWVLTWRDLLA